MGAWLPKPRPFKRVLSTGSALADSMPKSIIPVIDGRQIFYLHEQLSTESLASARIVQTAEDLD
jgi:hypothetical protein